ncbi:MAG: ABC transporter permease [Pseudomonadota bacterium]
MRPLTIIEAGRGEQAYWRDVLAYRDLLWVLVWRDLSVRYKQAVVGVAWALLQPLFTMLILSFVFSRLARLPSPEGVPYVLLVLSGVLPWTLFSGGVSSLSGSLITNANLITKIYFPRILVPFAAALTSLVEFCLAMGLLLLMLLWYGVWPDARVFALPLFLLLALGTMIGTGVAVSALNVAYRDFRYVVPFTLQIGLYLTPVGFTTSLVHEHLPAAWVWLYYLNPMAGAIEGFRWSLFGDPTEPYWTGIVISTVVMMALLYGGIRFFRRTERTFADII